MTNPAEIIQRYTPISVRGMTVMSNPTIGGDWVKYEDHQRILAAALAEVEAMRMERDEHDRKRFPRLCHKIESVQEACKCLRAALEEEVPARRSAETRLERSEFLLKEALAKLAQVTGVDEGVG